LPPKWNKKHAAAKEVILGSGAYLRKRLKNDRDDESVDVEKIEKAKKHALIFLQKWEKAAFGRD